MQRIWICSCRGDGLLARKRAELACQGTTFGFLQQAQLPVSTVAQLAAVLGQQQVPCLRPSASRDCHIAYKVCIVYKGKRHAARYLQQDELQLWAIHLRGSAETTGGAGSLLVNIARACKLLAKTYFVLALGRNWQHISASHDAQQPSCHVCCIAVGQEVKHLTTQAILSFCEQLQGNRRIVNQTAQAVNCRVTKQTSSVPQHMMTCGNDTAEQAMKLMQESFTSSANSLATSEASMAFDTWSSSTSKTCAPKGLQRHTP